MDDDEIEGGDEINEDLTEKSETITSSLERVSSKGITEESNLNCPESEYKSTDEETKKSNGGINEKMDDDEIEGGDEINEDLTEKSGTITSSLERVSSKGITEESNLNCPESEYKSTDEETKKSNGGTNEKMDDDEIEGGDEINEDLTEKSETVTSSLESSSSLERVSSKSITEESEDKGMETDDDVDENLPDNDTTSEKKNRNVVQDADDDEEERINENIQKDDVNKNEKDQNDEEEKGKTQEQQTKTDKRSNKGSKIEKRVIDENQKNIAKDESQKKKKKKKKTDEDQINQNDETSDSQIKVNNSDQHDDEMDTSTGEKEFTQFLTQTPQQFEEAMEDGEKGIIINDQDIIKPEDVFGRGKRCRTPKTDAIYTSDYDHDFDPKEETRARRFVNESRRSQAKQTSDSPKKGM
jgi:hypothetical protein